MPFQRVNNFLGKRVIGMICLKLFQESLSSTGNVTVINPSTAADAINVTNKANKDAIIVLANSNK